MESRLKSAGRHEVVECGVRNSGVVDPGCHPPITYNPTTCIHRQECVQYRCARLYLLSKSGSVEFQSLIRLCPVISRLLDTVLLEHTLYSIKAHLQRLLARSITQSDKRVALWKHVSKLLSGRNQTGQDIPASCTDPFAC